MANSFTDERERAFRWPQYEYDDEILERRRRQEAERIELNKKQYDQTVFFLSEEGKRQRADCLKKGCPWCSSVLELRDSRNGPFWGCTRYPICRGNLDATIEERVLFSKSSTKIYSAPYKEPVSGPVTRPAVPPTPQTPDKKEDQSMATNIKTCTPDLAAVIKQDLADGAWRTSAEETLELVRQPLVAALGAHTNNATSAGVAAFLSTPEGAAVLSSLLGLAPLFFPQLQDCPKKVRLAKELRVAGAKTATDKIIKPLAQPIIAAFTKVAAGLPDLPPGVTEQ